MNLDTDVVKKLLRSFEFERLFVELGWDHLQVHAIDIAVNHETYRLEPVAQKRGVQVYVCWAQRIPGAVLRHTVDARVTRSVHEHLLIFAQSDKSRQVWQWVAHEAGQPHFLRSFEWRRGQDGNVLAQRLAEIAIPINEEESIDLTLVIHRLKDAFDRDHVTKSFYERFAKQREQFQGSIKGMPEVDAKWYTSVVVDRLMFIYFLQKQGFLANGDRDYLRGKLDFIQFKGPDQYYGDFLTTLFFEGFAKPTDQRSAETQRMLGNIPYLNGGLFAPHDLEVKYKGRIQIPDVAFDKLLTFFDQYQWTLDDRPLGHDNEINPDVLGYIFEKYVNQKQMGAYYTKEDITGYISQETIIPRLFDMVKAKYKPAFTGEHSVFTLLKDAPDTYIYASMRKGARDEDGNKTPLPDNIAQGLHDVSKRSDWNRPADAAYALPTEIWREVVARTQRYEEVRRHCTDGDITDINDFITYNLDIRQFAQDAIAQSDDPVFVLEFFKALTTITVLDPTVGSGAFLFAALNILARLYEVCLQRMEQFQQDGVAYTGQALRAVQQSDAFLKEADKHSNRRYYILKSVVVHNLYGVDIMEEAVEICKLRLFLRLVAELKPGQPVEPLPDIDFNIKTGNTLVGYAHLNDVQSTRADEFFGKDRLSVIENGAADLARLYRKMQDQQMVLGGRVTPEDKRALQERRKQLVDELDEYLAYDYGIQTKKPKALQTWCTSAQPFHWFAEFYDILASGGFDVVIGNPPYVEYPSDDITYEVDASTFETAGCRNLYAPVLEQALDVSGVHSRDGLIVPISLMDSPRMGAVRNVIAHDASQNWFSSFALRPQPLFQGVMQRNTIWIALCDRDQDGLHQAYVTTYNRWLADERQQLFSCLKYCDAPLTMSGDRPLPKVGSPEELHLVEALATGGTTSAMIRHDRAMSDLWVHDSGESYWTKCLWDRPLALRNGKPVEPAQWFRIEVPSSSRDAVYVLLNSDIVYWAWCVWTDCRHMTKGFLESLAVPSLRDIDTEGVVGDLKAAYIASTVMFAKRPNYVSPEITVHNFHDVIIRATAVAARGLRLTSAQLDFLTSFQIKHRLGADDGDEADE